MMLRYKARKESLADELPNDAAMRQRGILDQEFPICRNALGLSSTRYQAFKTVAGLKNMLERYRPIWCSGLCATRTSTSSWCEVSAKAGGRVRKSM